MEAARAASYARRFQAKALQLDTLAPPEPKVVINDGVAMEVMADVQKVEADKSTG